MAEKGKPPGKLKKLCRSGDDRVIAGVCGGIAEDFGWDPVMVRLALVLFTLLGGAGILFYIIAWIIMPKNPAHKWK